MIPTIGYAAHCATGPLNRLRFDRREPGPSDIHIQMLYCGVCHSDVSMVDNDWGFSAYPMVPGHEMVGRVLAVGAAVSRFRPGDLAAVGCMIDSCHVCPSCAAGLEQYCAASPVSSFGSYERGTHNMIFGGFSSSYVLHERFALKVPDALDPARAAPLLCAGITCYSPLRHYGIGAGSTVGIVGIGGLGHIGIKLARAMGAKVIAVTSSPAKREDAIALGSHEVIVSTDKEQMRRHAGQIDLILDTVSGDHDVPALLELLRRDGTLCLLGIPKNPIAVHPLLLRTKRNISGSIMGGITETQQLLDFCATHGIAPDVEILPVSAVNTAFERLKRNDVRYRFVLDMRSLQA